MQPRVQLALNVTDLEEGIAFYSRLLDAEPAKVKPGYANFALDEPALKLVLIENEAGDRLNHLGIEVGSTEEVVSARTRISEAGLPARDEDGVTCCWATQDKVWVTDPDGAAWEVYTVLDDADVGTDTGRAPAVAGCCST